VIVKYVMIVLLLMLIDSEQRSMKYSVRIFFIFYIREMKRKSCLACSLCRSPIKHNDLSNLRLTSPEIQAIQLYQQGKFFEFEHAAHFTKQKSIQVNYFHTKFKFISYRSIQTTNNAAADDDDDDLDILLLNQQQCLPKYWALPMLTNFSRSTLDLQSTEYKFVTDKFYRSWANFINQMPAPPPAHNPVPVRPIPPVLVQSTNNPQQSPFQPAVMQRFIPTNNTNGSSINQPPVNNVYAPFPYQPHPGLIVPTPSFPPFLPQQRHPHNVHYGHTRAPVLVNNRTAASSRHRAVNHGNGIPKIIQIERIQNQRWYKQYSAHECEFRQKIGKQTQQWLFHG
jgi:hypothetical protein